MPADETLLNRVRELLEDIPDVEEKRMFGGVAFLVDDKMCVNVVGDELMCRVGPEAYDEAIERPGARALLMGGREYRGYLYVEPEMLRSKQELKHWVDLCLAYNPQAESSKKKKPGEKARRVQS